MKVSQASPHSHSPTHQESTYYFCCTGCQKKFSGNPDKYLNPPKQSARRISHDYEGTQKRWQVKRLERKFSDYLRDE